jgi:hypothetical protein
MRLISQNDCKIVWCICNSVCASRSSRQASHGTCARSDGVLLTIREGGASFVGSSFVPGKSSWYFLSFNVTFCCLVSVPHLVWSRPSPAGVVPVRCTAVGLLLQQSNQTTESRIETQKSTNYLCQVQSWTRRGGPTLPYSQQHTIWTCTGSVRRLPWRSRCTHSITYTPHNSTIILTSQSHTLDLILTPYANEWVEFQCKHNTYVWI